MDLVTLDIDAGLARLTLNRPDKLNALNQNMHEAMADALDRLEQSSGIRCLWLSAAGRAFCVGQDLSERRAMLESPEPPDLGASLEQRYNPLIRRLSRLPFPTLCSVQGAAAGAGVGLALACDLVIAARSVRFIFAFSRLGLGPDAGVSYQLPRLIGLARARKLVLTGEELDAQKAFDWGLIGSCCEDDDLERLAQEQADRLRKAPTLGLNLCREALNHSADNNLDEQLDLERDLQRRAGHSRDYREGIQAFFDKRTAQFLGE